MFYPSGDQQYDIEQGTPLISLVAPQLATQAPQLTASQILLECGKLTGPMLLASVVSTASFFMKNRTISTITGEEGLEASALITGLEWLLIIFPAGLQAVATRIAKQAGHCIKLERERTGVVGSLIPVKEWSEIGKLYQHGLITASVYAAISAALFLGSAPFLRAFGQSENLIDLVAPYCKIYSIGIPGYILWCLNSQYANAMESQWAVTGVQAVAGVIGNAMGYGLMTAIPGTTGDKMLGMAWAVVAEYWFSALALQAVMTLSQKHKQSQLYQKPKFDRIMLKDLFLTALPTQFFLLFEMSQIFMLTAMAGWIGPKEIAAMQIAINYLALQGIPSFRLGEASNILVARYRGEERFIDMKRIGNTNIALGVAFECLCELIFLVTPLPLVRFMMKDQDPMMNMSQESIETMAASALQWVGIGQIPDAWRLIAAGGLRGMEDNIYNAVVCILMLWGVGVPASIALSQTLGLVGLAIGRNIGLTLTAIIVGTWYHIHSNDPRPENTFTSYIQGLYARRYPATQNETRETQLLLGVSGRHTFYSNAGRAPRTIFNSTADRAHRSTFEPESQSVRYGIQ